MPPKHPTRNASVRSKRRRRADAERSVARILDAAVDALASDPEASMAGIAHRAGVVRATIYVHFPTRESLIEAVTERAIAEVTQAMSAAEPSRGRPRRGSAASAHGGVAGTRPLPRACRDQYPAAAGGASPAPPSRARAPPA